MYYSKYYGYMNRTLAALAAGAIWLTAACKPVKMDVYEKNREIPGHTWSYDHKPDFEVTLQPEDTAYLYNIYVNVRHTDAYPYSNIWVMVGTRLPGDSLQTRRVELPLADVAGKWLGSGLDDIYEHRIPIQQRAVLDKPGVYHFTFEQNMRQNPLPSVMNVGLRIEKAGLRQ